VLSEDNGDNSGQLTLTQSFARARQQTLGHVMDLMQDLLAIDNDELSDIKSMEELYDEIRDDPLYQRLFEIANVHTAEQFGLAVPDGVYKEMAGAIDDGDEWGDIRSQDWFNSAQATAEDQSFFHWELEYPEVFFSDEGKKRDDFGFDAVIGNPPYGYRKIPTEQEKQYYSSNFDSHQYNYEFYVYFTETAINLTQKNKRTSYIIPNTYISADNMENMRKYILDSCAVSEIYSLGQGVFEGVTLESVIQTLEVGKSGSNVRVRVDKNTHNLTSPEKEYMIHQNEFESSDDHVFNIFLSPERRSIVEKIKEGTPLEELAYVTVGINTGYIKDVLVSDEKEDDRHHRMVSGKHIDRYHLDWNGDWICYDHDLIEEYGDKARSLPPEYIFLNDKILLQRTRRGLDRKLVATLDTEQHYNLNRASNIVLDEETPYELGYILALMNSNLLDLYFNWVFDEYEVKPSHLNKIPIKELDTGSEDCNIITIKNVYRKYTKAKKSVHEVIRTFQNLNDEEKHDFLAFLAEKIEENKSTLSDLNLNLPDHFGNYSDGQSLDDVGLIQPPAGAADSILRSTASTYPNLRVGEANVVRESISTVEIQLTARYKPEELDEDVSGPVDDREADQWGYVETDLETALRITDLTEIEADLIEAFVPVAIDEAGGFANFRETATKRNSLVDRLHKLTLPAVSDVETGLKSYTQTKERAEELEAKIEQTDELIDEIVYELYGLTDEEIEIVEEAVST